MMKSLLGSLFLVVTLAVTPGCKSEKAESTPSTDPVVTPPDYCAENGLSKEPFNSEAGGYLFGDLAEDFTVNELGGKTWNLSENWTGCESYVFFSYFQFLSESGQAYMNGLWNSSLQGIISASAKNAHYFFISTEVNENDRVTRMEGLKQRLLSDLNALFADKPEENIYWKDRFHFVTDRLTFVEGSVGGFVNDFLAYKETAPPVDLGDRGNAPAPYPMSFAIGRDQRWDPTGSLSEHVGGPENLKMIAYNPAFYNHRAELRARLAAETDTTVLSLIDESVTSRVFLKEATFPDAAAMAEMDTFEFDVAITCPHRNPFGCSEWDRIARISLCTEFDAEDTESCTASTEVVRWITPYWRRGRRHWVMDASPFLGLVQEGGTQRFRIEMGPSWERGTERVATMSVRLSNKDSGLKSRSVIRAFGGGGFNAEYNTGREAFAFTPPADAKRVEIVSIISGHGQTESDNCAEWCNHVHTFTVNDSADAVHEVAYTDIGNPVGCAARANEGALPGQWGNWSQSRAGWCPGLPVETVRFDITSEVTLGEENTLSYRGSFRGGEPNGGDISKNTYIVWYMD